MAVFPVNPIIRKILEQLFLLLSGLGPTSLGGYCDLVGSWWGDFSLLVFWGLLFLFPRDPLCRSARLPASPQVLGHLFVVVLLDYLLLYKGVPK